MFFKHLVFYLRSVNICVALNSVYLLVDFHFFSVRAKTHLGIFLLSWFVRLFVSRPQPQAKWPQTFSSNYCFLRDGGLHQRSDSYLMELYAYVCLRVCSFRTWKFKINLLLNMLSVTLRIIKWLQQKNSDCLTFNSTSEDRVS